MRVILLLLLLVTNIYAAKLIQKVYPVGDNDCSGAPIYVTSQTGQDVAEQNGVEGFVNLDINPQDTVDDSSVRNRWCDQNYNIYHVEIFPQINELEKKLTKTHFALTNLTDQFQVIYISGEKSRWVLSKGCHIDLDQSIFSPNNCAQTNLALVDITIFCTAKNSFTMLFRNSFANYILDWLQDASFDCNYQYLSR